MTSTVSKGKYNLRNKNMDTKKYKNKSHDDTYILDTIDSSSDADDEEYTCESGDDSSSFEDESFTETSDDEDDKEESEEDEEEQEEDSSESEEEPSSKISEKEILTVLAKALCKEKHSEKSKSDEESGAPPVSNKSTVLGKTQQLKQKTKISDHNVEKSRSTDVTVSTEKSANNKIKKISLSREPLAFSSLQSEKSTDDVDTTEHVTSSKNITSPQVPSIRIRPSGERSKHASSSNEPPSKQKVHVKKSKTINPVDEGVVESKNGKSKSHEESDEVTPTEKKSNKNKSKKNEIAEKSEENEKDKNVNIIFSIKTKRDDFEDEDEYYDEDYLEDEFEEYMEDENEEFDSEDEKIFMKENYIDLPIPENTDTKKSTKKSSKKTKKIKEEQVSNDTTIVNIEEEYMDLLDTKKHLVEKLLKNPSNKLLKNALTECNSTLNALMKSARSNNTKLYCKLVIGKQKKQCELEYFRNKLSNKEQIEIMKDLKEVNDSIHIEKPYRLSILQSNIPANFKAIAIQKLNMLRSMDPGDTEYFKIKNWVDTFMRIPFSTYKGMSVNIDDGIDKCSNFLENAKNKLDECVYGLEDAKLQIMQMIGQWISNPSAMGTAIAIKGPMGTGKSSLVKDGISKILGREFAFIALGGAGDSSFLEGHSYTYEGSTWGKIVQILIDSKCMNPVIYFDELDKISDSPRGQEIIGILTHLTDTTQNNQFHDKYFSELDFDLSKCLFIFSYNDDNLVNSILKDRMYCIQTKGYDVKEKIIIAKNYLLPKIREQVNMPENNVIIPDETIQYIINNKNFTKEESGVRNLKRCLEIIYTKLNLFRLIKPENNIFAKQMDIEVTFPFTVTKKHVDTLIKNEENQNQSLITMYI
jgi:ATP-dependent Lon protease